MDTSQLPRSTRILHLPFDRRAVEPIAEELEAQLALAPFALPGGLVHQLTVYGADGRPATMVTLWPTIRRVDAIGQNAAVVFTDVVSVDLVPGVEVQFRRSSREFLIVARGGKIIVRA
jgi:hypothetical protein